MNKLLKKMHRSPFLTISVLAFLLVAIPATVFLTLQNPNPVSEADTLPGFLDTFDGDPTSPQPFTSPNWDIVVNVSDSWLTGSNWPRLNNVHAHHGSDCAPPLATHVIDHIRNAVFNCRNHMMTSMDGGGYGAVYMTPNHKVNFQNGEAVIRWDVSSFRASGRTWWDVWVQPYQDNFQLPLEDWLPPYQGEPKNAVSIKMEGVGFEGFVDRNFEAQSLAKTADGWKSLEQVLQENGLKLDPARRDTYELRISRNHIKFGLPAFNHWWIDTQVADLGWGDGIVSLGHHEYNSSKDCNPNPPTDCYSTTFHWDNMSISPSIPFTIIRGVERGINSGTSNKINFPSPAPPNSHLRFAATGTIQLSFDNGATYRTVPKLQQEKNKPEHFSNYWTPIPAGTASVLVKGGPDSFVSQWLLRDPAIFSETSNGSPITTTVTLTPTLTPTSTLTPTVAPTSTPTPTKIPTPIPTPTPTTVPNSQTLSFDDHPSPGNPLSGQFPTAVADWGSGAWYVSSPWRLLFTNSVSFNGAGITSANVTFPTPRRLVRLDAYADTATTLTLSCSGQTTRTFNLAAGSLGTLSTGWTGNCSTVTIASTNGWDTNFDNFVVSNLSGATPSPTPSPTPIPTPNPSLGTGLSGNYFQNRDFTGFVLTRADRTVNFNWGSGSPHSSINRDTFSVRWTGQVLAPVSGQYTFYTRSDDGVRLWVDDQLIINNWSNHAATENSSKIILEAGKKYNIKMEYYENTGRAVAELRWSAPGISKQTIPTQNLFVQ